MVPLPESVRDSLRIYWMMSQWCNYQCNYCGVPVYSRRPAEKHEQLHAFDQHPVEAWVKAFRRFRQCDITMTITGGEPFLDRKNFRPLLEGLAALEAFTLMIHSNCSWTPEYYHGVEKRRAWIVATYHASQTRFEPFRDRLLRIREAGFPVAKVSIVLAPENIETAEECIDRLESDGFVASVNAMEPSGMHLDTRMRSDLVIDLLQRHALPLNVYFQVVRPVTRGRLCYHPAFAYRLEYDGTIRVACLGGPAASIFRDPLPELPAGAAPCPFQHCYGCPDMIRSLVDEPMYRRPLTVYHPSQFLQEYREYQEARRADPGAFRKTLEGVMVPGTGQDVYALFQARVREAERPAEPYQVPANLIRHAVPDLPIFGYIDRHNGADIIEARAADRILVSGWAVSSRHGAPLREVRLTGGGKPMGYFRGFYPRPEVVATFGRDDFLESGWRGLCFVPRLPRGEYPLVATAMDRDGETAALPALSLRITG
jgi:MoaA/NifB/PqqE/SkfB family radical SAM enzyme